MSLVQIPNLTPAIALNGTEQLEAVQAGSSVRLTSAQIALLASPYAGNPLLPALGGTGTGTIFTTGSVVFAGASGIYQQNNSKFFWDNTNFRLGVGTATPAYNLDVSGTASVSGTLGVTGAATFSSTLGVTGGVTLGTQQTTQGSLVLANTAAGAFPTTIRSSNSASAAWTLTLPTTAGTNNHVLTTNGSGVSSWSQVSLTAGVTGVLPVANGGTNANSAGITAFNNITGYTAAGATGTTSANLVFSTAPTLTGAVLAAGTTTVAPLRLTSGTNLSTAATGTVEYDGSVFYATSVASSRQVVCTEQFVCVGATPVSLSSTSTAAQNVFAAANDALTVAASTTYFFEAYIYLSTGNVTHTTAFGLGGTATFTSVLYDSMLVSSAANTISTSGSMVEVTTASATVLNATSTAVTTKIQLRGVLRINAGGTIIPQVTFSAGPTGTCQTNTNSWFRLWPVGSNTVQAVGNWS